VLNVEVRRLRKMEGLVWWRMFKLWSAGERCVGVRGEEYATGVVMRQSLEG